MVFPSAALLQSQGIPSRSAWSYAAQLHLRMTLNAVQGLLYAGGADGSGATLPGATAKSCLDALLDRRGPWTGGLFGFNDGDPPPADLLAARLRASYWAAHALLHRGYLKRILDFNHDRRERGRPPLQSVASFLQAYPRGEAGPHETLNGAHRAVTAHVKATTAFHGLGARRFIVTNPFGLAHA